ncbi:hypothetical protein [Paracoccus sp. SSK6]|uniref:hypothetical protein n=1 Tax=Paracoccus sp. SSK6 TaxID=3143131 RepID=UPI00321B4D11
MAIFSAIAYGIGYTVGFLGAAAGLSTTTILSLATVATNVIGSVSLNLVARALAPKPTIPQTEIKAIINQVDAPRRIYVGRYMAGGIRAFFDVKGAALYQLILLNHGRIDRFISFWMDGKKVSLDSDGNVTSGNAANWTRVYTRDGAALGGNYTPLTANFGYWSANRRIQGQATFLVRMWMPKAEDFMKVFPKSYNTSWQWEFDSSAVYDPRTGQTAYKDNAALVEAFYLTHQDGYRLTPAEMNWASFSAMADVSDIPIPQKKGGTAPNLRLWGYWTLDEEPSQVLDRMHTSSGIRPYEMQDGRIGLIGGPFGEPACTLTAKDIEEIQTSEAISEREGYNVLRIFHLDPKQNYEIMEVAEWRDESRLAVEGEIPQEYRLEMCPNLSQARRLAKRQMHDDNRQKITIITNLVGLKARWPRFHGQRHTILLDYQPEDGSGRIIQGEYEVLDHEFDPVEMKCRIELGRVSRASEAWEPADEGESTADLPDDEGNPAPLMTATLTQRVVQVSAGTRQAILQVEAAAIPEREDLTIEAEYRKAGDSAWQKMVTTDLRAQSGAVEDGATYQVQVRWKGVFDGVAPRIPLGPITIQIDATPPGQPTELMPAGTSGISWRNPAGSFYAIRIYRGATNNLANAAFIHPVTGGASGQLSEYNDPVEPGTYYYWVRAANVSGVEGPAAGPVQITTT